MKSIDICPFQLANELHAGLQELCAHEGFRFAENGVQLHARQASAFRVQFDGNSLEVEYREPVQFFRALSYLKASALSSFLLCRQPTFQSNGVMLDCSRNAVPTVDTVKTILRKMSLMGLNTLMLYTEDTYEIPELPYFGYLRGRYSASQLCELDDYASLFGIEMVPCIQTLAHLERALHWPQVDPSLRDTGDILMVGEEKTYTFIEQMIQTVSHTFRSKRIHIGMDEAWSLGLGNFRFKNGFVPSHQIMERHLSRVCEITQKYGLHPIIWSDMYLRAASPSGGYYDVPEKLPEQVLNAARRDVPLVYWDYYHNDQDIYDRLIRVHQQFSAPIVFAGGLWTWIGPAPSHDKMRACSISALQACAANGVREVFATAWGDNGSETNLLTALYGMQLYAEFDYTGQTDKEYLAQRFTACTGEVAAAFELMNDFNALPDLVPKDDYPVNASKFLLYEDPLLPLFTADTNGMSFVEHYAGLVQSYRSFSSDAPAFEAIYRFYEQLAHLLELKCRWRERAPHAKADDNALNLAELAMQCMKQTKCCRAAWASLWERTNKPYGFEVIDIRLSGLEGRFETAAHQTEKLARNEPNTLETLFCPKLRYLSDETGHFSGSGPWSDCISACRI